jgi:hypothetical protein
VRSPETTLSPIPHYDKVTSEWKVPEPIATKSR